MKGKLNATISSEAVIYAFAHAETWLEDYAKSHRLPAYELTQRVAQLLFAQTGGTLLGIDDRVPALRRASAQGDKAARPVALAKRTHRKAQVACPHCERKFYPQGLAKHLRWKHADKRSAA